MTNEELKDKISKSNNLDSINNLRMDVVKSHNGDILKLWQDKYWSLKRCPTCGKLR